MSDKYISPEHAIRNIMSKENSDKLISERAALKPAIEPEVKPLNPNVGRAATPGTPANLNNLPTIQKRNFGVDTKTIRKSPVNFIFDTIWGFAFPPPGVVRPPETVTDVKGDPGLAASKNRQTSIPGLAKPAETPAEPAPAEPAPVTPDTPANKPDEPPGTDPGKVIPFRKPSVPITPFKPKWIPDRPLVPGNDDDPNIKPTPSTPPAPFKAPVYEPATVPDPFKAPVYEPASPPDPFKAPVYEPATVPDPFKAPVYEPATVPKPENLPEPASTTNPDTGAVPGILPVPLPAQGNTRDNKNGKGKNRIIPPFIFGGSTPGQSGISISGFESPDYLHMAKTRLADKSAKIVKENTADDERRAIENVPRPKSDRNKSMTRNQEIKKKIIDENVKKKSIIKDAVKNSKDKKYSVELNPEYKHEKLSD